MFALELSMEKLIKKFWMTLKNVYAVIASPFTDRIESCVRKKNAQGTTVQVSLWAYKTNINPEVLIFIDVQLLTNWS